MPHFIDDASLIFNVDIEGPTRDGLSVTPELLRPDKRMGLDLQH